MENSQTRRNFLKAVGLGALAMTVPGCSEPSNRLQRVTENDKRKKPNILFIMSDDHAAPAISAYGGFLSEVAKTPNLDRISDEGMRFNNCFCTNSICTPSRATILTGKYGHKNGCRTLGVRFDGSQQTFPKLLQKAGYYTGMIGKWHLKSDPTGFDYWNVLPGQGRYFDPVMIEMGQKKQHNGYVTDIITGHVLEFLQKRPEDQPFYLCYHNKGPHDMWEYEKQYAGLYKDKDIPEPPTLFDDYENRGQAIKKTTEKVGVDTMLYLHDTENDQFDNLRSELNKLPPKERKRQAYQYFIKAYLRCVASIDENIGKVLKFLDSEGLTNDTLVIYTSDQGYFLGQHGLFDKRFMYEESLRMPLLARYPREIRPASVNNDIVTNLDFAETFLDYADVTVPQDMQGTSIRPLLKGRTLPDWRKSMYYRYWLHGAHFNIPAHFGVRTDRYKLIYYYGKPLDVEGAKGGPTPPEWELFDLWKDHNEMKNVYDRPDYANVVKKLKHELVRLRHKYEDDKDGIVVKI